MDIPSDGDHLEFIYEQGWTDGLPVVPPTEERVEAFVRYIGTDPDAVIGAVAPAGGIATVEKIASNAVMAGCRPEYMPVIVAALQAMMDDRFNLYGVAASTLGAAPLLIINGPIRKVLDINCRSNLFGPGWRANATIGRAIRLILMNIGHAVPGDLDRGCFGQPGRFSFCIGEDEEGSPWEPFHVDRGYARDDSTVTVFAGEPPHTIDNCSAKTAEQLLLTIADSMSHLGSSSMIGQGEMVVIINPEMMETIQKAGLSKVEVKRFLYQHARRPVADLKRVGRLSEAVLHYDVHAEANGQLVPVKSIMTDFETVRPGDEALQIPVVRQVDDILLLAAGGTGRPISVCLPGWAGYSQTLAITKSIDECVECRV